MKTNPEEFNKFIRLLPENITPHLIPVTPTKSPDIPRGENAKDKKYRLSVAEARKRLKHGKNVGMYLRDDFAVLDIDNPEKARDYFNDDIKKKTLTVSSRSGKPHIWFLKGDGIKGRDIPDVVELRTGWRYVLLPGSCAYDQSEFEETGEKKLGLYTVANPNKPIELCVEDLPKELQPEALEDVDIEVSEEVEEIELVNKHEWKIGDIRQRDKKLDILLSELNPKGHDYPSRSEADLAAMQKLLYWEFDDNTICQILRKFRQYEKTERTDYLDRTLRKAKTKIEKTISQDKDPACWNPVDGLMYHEKGKFVPKLLAEAIMEDYQFITLEDTEEIYAYQDGIFCPVGEIIIKSEAQARLGKHAKKHYQNEVVNFIRSATYTPRTELDKNPHVLVVKNGTLNIKTRELEPHSPNPRSTTKIPVEYDPDAECPRVENFLSEVLKKEDVPLIQEFVGYCLLKEHRFHKAIMLTGGGSNGKTTFLNLVRALLGRDNVSSASLHDLIYNRFAKADLYGKLANVHSDIPDYVLKRTGPFKMLTGEDLIYAEKKHRDAFHFENFAKLLFSANEIPETKDKTRAFFRRWLIIEFPYKFTSEKGDGNKDKDPRMLEKITTEKELSGFLNWALEGLERLLENNDFSTELTVGERAEIWEEMSDPIIAFKEAELVVDPNVYGTKEEVYNAYASFCHKRNTPPLDKNVFSRELPKRFPVEIYRPRINGRRTQCWKGLSLKEDAKVVKDVKDKRVFRGDMKRRKTRGTNYVHEIENIPDIPDQQNVVDEILQFLQFYGGKTPKEIADHLNMDLEIVEKLLEAMFDAEILERGQETISGGRIYNIMREG